MVAELQVRLFCAVVVVVVVEGATVRPFLTETATMIFIGILAGIAAIGVLCWLLFTLGVFALPVFAAPPLAIGLIRPAQAGPAGSSSALSAALTLGIGQFMLASVRPLWLRLAIAMVFVAPAALAGYHATHGIVKHTMPSDTWQIVFSVIGAIAVGVTAFVRVAAMAAPGPSGRGLARA